MYKRKDGCISESRRNPHVELVCVALALLFWPIASIAQSPLCPIPALQSGASLTWGIRLLGFPEAWSKSCGTALIGVLDNGIELEHPFLQANFRPHLLNRDDRFEEVLAPIGHGTHVAGIISASLNAQNGVVGACRNCSTLLFHINGPTSSKPQALMNAVLSGVQVVNMSFRSARPEDVMESEISAARDREIVLVAAAGNSDRMIGDTPIPDTAITYPASNPYVISVGGLREDPARIEGADFWAPEPVPTALNSTPPATSGTGSGLFGSASGVSQFVTAPARRVLSTFYLGQSPVSPGGSSVPELDCRDEPSAPGPRFGFCSGTSMAAPHVTALLGIVRSANPLLSAAEVKAILRKSARNPTAPGSEFHDNTFGYGIPSADRAVGMSLAGSSTSPSSKSAINRTTPLFALFSSALTAHLYTVIPQVAMTASLGQWRPAPTAPYIFLGNSIPGYPALSTVTSIFPQPKSALNVFTTHRNPFGGSDLIPLKRYSWRCEGGIGQCAQSDVGFAYLTDDSDASISALANHKFDGIEGFVFPRAAVQPPNTVRLCRKFNSSRSDSILFPGVGLDGRDCSASNDGDPARGEFFETVGEDWIGYVPSGSSLGSVCSSSQPSNFSNGGFEVPVVTGLTSTMPIESGWTIVPSSGIGGILPNTAVQLPYPPASEGTQYGYFHGYSTLRRAVTLSGGSYQVSFRSMKQVAGTLMINVKVNGSLVASVSPGVQNWAFGVTNTFFVNDGVNIIDFEANSYASAYIYLDDIRIVSGATNLAPTISQLSVSPTPGQAIAAPAAFRFSAGVNDPDGCVTKVEYFSNGSPTPFATANWAPFEVEWTGVPAGTYSIVAKAHDDRGAVTESLSVTLVVSGSSGPAQPTMNGSFEVPVISGSPPSQMPIESGWTVVPAGGIAGIVPNSAVQPPYPLAKDGNQFGYFEGTSTLRRTINLDGRDYRLTLWAMAQNAGSPALRIRVNGANVGLVVPGNQVWKRYTTDAFATNVGSNTIDFMTEGPGAGAYLYLDRIELREDVRQLVPRMDFDASQTADLLWRRPSGEVAIWLMDGVSLTSAATIYGGSLDWTVSFHGDFDGDGRSDLVWTHTDGSVALWRMDGINVLDGQVILGPGTNWRVVQVSDTDGDGRADLLWRHTDGSYAIWTMNGFNPIQGVVIFGSGTAWEVVGIGDLNGDGMADLVWSHADGRVAAWLMQGTSVLSSSIVIDAGPAWTFVKAADFDGDGRSDILLVNSDGSYGLWLMNGTSVLSAQFILGPGTGWQVAIEGDFSGDGSTDLLWRHADGRHSIWLMNGFSSTTAILPAQDSGWLVTHARDFNGDGKTDLLWRHSDGRSALWIMDGLQASSTSVVHDGSSGWYNIPGPQP